MTVTSEVAYTTNAASVLVNWNISLFENLLNTGKENVKSCDCVYTMKTCRGSGGIAPHILKLGTI